MHPTATACGLASLASTALLLTATVSRAEMTDMTLYTFDKDQGGQSACYDDCATAWPPYIAAEGEALGDGWTQVSRSDGSMQWAYDGKPVYFYVEDTAPGEAKGDGKGGVWHVLKP